MTTATAMTPADIKQRLDFLAKREKVIRSTPSSDPDAILSEDETLEAIRQEKRDLAQQLKEYEERAQQDRQAKADTRALARDDALKERDHLLAQLRKKTKAFEEFVELYQEAIRLGHVAHVADRQLQQQRDERAMGLEQLEAGRAMDRTRVALTNLFGPDLFGLPPFAQKRNEGYGIRDAAEGAAIRLY